MDDNYYNTLSGNARGAYSRERILEQHNAAPTTTRMRFLGALVVNALFDIPLWYAIDKTEDLGGLIFIVVLSIFIHYAVVIESGKRRCRAIGWDTRIAWILWIPFVSVPLVLALLFWPAKKPEGEKSATLKERTALLGHDTLRGVSKTSNFVQRASLKFRDAFFGRYNDNGDSK